ncbi:hypothetical protein GBAR_LOCUS19471 [Geodia barretti]|nr:hypothetical protein GBAR_LOCUS19471 [Geodia barretti]
MPSSSQAIGTWYESSRLTQEWPQYAALSVNITPNSQGRKRQEGDIEVSFTIGNSSMTCGPTDTVCNGPLNPSADYGIRYTLFSGIQSQEFPFFPGAQFTTERIPSDEQSSNIGAIVGAVVGVLLAVLVIITVAAVVGYFVFNARRKGIIELTGYVITSSKPSERPLLSHKNGSTHANNTNKPPMFLSPSDPGIVPLGQVNKNAAGATGKSRSPSRKANSRRMMLKDLSEAVRDMLNDSGYIFSEEYEKVTEVGLDHSKEASLMAENRARIATPTSWPTITPESNCLTSMMTLAPTTSMPPTYLDTVCDVPT